MQKAENILHNSIEVGAVRIKRVEIEINSQCNRRCSYCPNSLIAWDKPSYMSFQLFEKIVGELVEMKFNGRLSYHFYNEPLLHPNIEEFVMYVARKLPRVENVLYTNGDFLTDFKYKQLINAGLSHFVITKHGSNAVKKCEKMTILTPADLELTNRGGSLFALNQPMQKSCYVPTERLLVGHDGAVMLCYEDAKREVILGNISNSTIKDIWFSQKYTKIREQLAAGLRNELSPCNQCNNLAHIAPNYVSKINIAEENKQ